PRVVDDCPYPQSSAKNQSNRFLIQALGDHERWERCTETKVITGFFNMPANLDVDGKGSVIGLSTVASAAAFLTSMLPINSTLFSLGEAYRITIPFVAHIAMLKMLYPSETGQQK
uniref:hypothetical protein n=1 Tax=Komagataeibacter rhaeticus TaxID=215221 RepID=UPI00248F94B8